ncbi:MAG: hypothetical protein CSB44_06775 [Gammaproteobacteria bacterium]|nr:MAG: hypothetical protein CSB44_06775 [Gammaproteobacteria bacterium]
MADRVPGYGREAMFRDMDAWGYSFRLGSARRWFEEDAEDALRFLKDRSDKLLDTVPDEQILQFDRV